MRARTAPRRVAGTAIGVLLALGLALGPAAGPAAAAPADGQAADRVAQLADQLADAQAAADAAHADSALALDEYQVRNERFTAARAAADQATAAAVSAEADLQAARTALRDFARRSYMSHSTWAGAAALLTSGSPTELLERAALLDAAGAHSTDEVGRFTAARDTSGQAQAAAQATLAEATTLQQAAADALTRAENAERSARQQATDLAAEQQLLQQQLDAAQAALPAATAPVAQPVPAAVTDPVATTEAGPGSAQQAQAAVEAALTQLGVPYSWGGGSAAGPGPGLDLDAGVVGYDCSALTQYAYARAGVAIPRTSREQFTDLPKVAKADLQPGDLLFWAHDPADPATIFHVALYLGGGKVVQAPQSGDVVKISDVWWTGYAGAVRPSA